jgi:hypothetical protein
MVLAVADNDCQQEDLQLYCKKAIRNAAVAASYAHLIVRLTIYPAIARKEGWLCTTRIFLYLSKTVGGASINYEM